MRQAIALVAAGVAALFVLLVLQRCGTPPEQEARPVASAPGAGPDVAPESRAPRARAADESPQAGPQGAGAAAQPVPAPPPGVADDAKKPAAPLYAEVAGRVLLAAGGAPVADVTVALRGTNVSATLPERSATTDGRGEFRFAAVPPGTFVLVASKTGFAPRKVYGIEVTRDRGREGVELLLTVGGTIEGHVTDERSAPAAGLHVRLELGNPTVPAGSATTDAEGNYRFEHVLPEQYHVEVDRGGGRTQAGFVDVTDDRVARLDFRSDATIAGVVVDAAGKPLAGAMVTAWSAGPPTVNQKARTGADGSYSIAGLTPGEWAMQIQTFGDDGFAAPAGKLTVAAGENAFPIRVEPGEISGRVFARATGAALPPRSLQLSLRPLDPKAGPFASAMAFAKTDGAFRFAGLAAGRYRIWAYSHDPSLKALELDVDLAAGEHREGVDIALEGCRTGKFRVVARDAAGKPAEGLTVAVVNADGSRMTGPTPSPEPGVYVLRLEIGSRALELSRADLQTSRVTADLKEGETSTVETVLAPKETK
jgi:carboxypeptidase family protein